MKRLIIKTAGNTLAAIFGVFVLGVVGMTLFAPGAMGDLCQQTGSYGLAAWYAELDYAKSKEIDKLARVIYLADLAGNDETLVDTVRDGGAQGFFRILQGDGSSGKSALFQSGRIPHLSLFRLCGSALSDGGKDHCAHRCGG